MNDIDRVRGVVVILCPICGFTTDGPLCTHQQPEADTGGCEGCATDTLHNDTDCVAADPWKVDPIGQVQRATPADGGQR